MNHPQPLAELDLQEIEELAKANAGEPYRGPLLALVDEVRRLRTEVRLLRGILCRVQDFAQVHENARGEA